MELNDATWLLNGLPGAEPRIYLGRLNQDFGDGGLRFHLDDRAQGEEFALARIRLFPADSQVTSGVSLLMRGADQDSVSEFRQSSRPSQKLPFTDASAAWEIIGWPVYAFPVFVASPDVSPIINEILARPDWGTGPEGKTVAILLDDNTQIPDEANYVAFEDYYGGSGNPAMLILYETVIDTFNGGPVLSKPKTRSISVSLSPEINAEFYIEYGPAPGSYTKAIGNSVTDLPDVDPVVDLDAGDAIELKIADLEPATRFYYRLRARKKDAVTPFEAGPESSFITRRNTGESYTFAVMADSHAGTDWASYDNDRWRMGFRTMANAIEAEPDFFVVAGDEACTSYADLSSQGFYDAILRYYQTRKLYGELASSAPIFLVLGNHDGEAGYHEPSIRTYSYAARSRTFFNPSNTTYPFGGGPKENYFAWTWGDALFICLDVFAYTGPEDPFYIEPYGSAWHLGEEQLNWLQATLSASQARWKFIFAHHILASFEKNGYGRGGAKYAHDWEQGVIHQMMLDYGAQIFFYGHDHVFADGTADGVHYTLASQCFGTATTPWITDPYFIDAYPYGFFAERGYIRVRVGPRSAWVDFIKTSLDDQGNGDVIYGYQLADVTADLMPPPDPDVSPGQWFQFDAVFTNSTDEAQVYDYWTTISFLDDGEFVIDLQENQTLAPNDAVTVPYNLLVPNWVNADGYTVTTEVGDYPDGVIAYDAFSGAILD
jgi:hypothetical protein